MVPVLDTVDFIFYDLDINKNRYFQHIIFDFYAEILETGLHYNIQFFYGEFINEMKKGGKIDFPRWGFEPQI